MTSRNGRIADLHDPLRRLRVNEPGIRVFRRGYRGCDDSFVVPVTLRRFDNPHRTDRHILMRREGRVVNGLIISDRNILVAGEFIDGTFVSRGGMSRTDVVTTDLRLAPEELTGRVADAVYAYACRWAS